MTGVTTMLTDIGMDTGDILMTKETPIGPNETYGELSERLAVLGAELLSETLNALEAGTLIRTPQNPAEATVCHMLTKEDGRIDFTCSAQTVHNLVRGTNPWPAAFALLDGELLKIWETHTCGSLLDAEPGTLSVNGNKLYVRCADACLEIVSLQQSGKKRMNADVFLRGCALDGKRLC